MKKILITLLAAVMVSGAVAQETPFPDIPAGHWAADAVARIADLGIVIGFPDGTFRGNESFTRYQVALVVSRLLDVVNANIEAAGGLSDADLASLRNAIQELAADLAAQGATVAALSDDVAANNARIDTLEDLLTDEGIDPEVFEDLQNQLASLRVAVDTAQARADQALAAANGVQAQVNQNAADLAVLEELVTRLNDDVLAILEGAEDAPPTTAGLNARVARTESDIANIREFVILLRRDQVALRQRVSAVESVNEQQDEQLADLETRVTELEENALTLSGSITLDYAVHRLSGDELPFDVDRVWGLNNERDMGASAFSTGSADLNDDGDETDVGEVAQDRDDIDDTRTGFGSSLDLSLAFGLPEREGTGPEGFNTFSAVLELDLTLATDLTDVDGDLFDGYVITFDNLTTFIPIGEGLLTFQFGEDPEAEFTKYVFDASGPGFVATVASPDFLAFLDPSLTVAYGMYDRDVIGDDADDFDDAYYRGAHLELNLFDGVTIGGSFAQVAEHAGENADAAGDNEEITVYGANGQVALSIFDLSFEYAQSTGMIDTDEDGVDDFGSDTALAFVTLGVDGESIPILDELTVTYRDIPGVWEGIDDEEDYPHALDQAGVKAEVGLGLFIIGIDGYYDMYVTGSPDASVTAYGADLTVELFRALSLTGFYHSISVDGVVVDSADAAGVERDDAYATEFGVELNHDGAAENALIPGLNLSVGYSQSDADFDTTTIFAEADFELSVSVLTLTPYAEYRTVTDADAGTDDTATIAAGAGLETAALDIFTSPSLVGAVNYRTTDHTDLEVYTASQLQWSVGIEFNEFLFENSVLTARYGSWTGTNIEDDTNTVGSGDFSTDISGGDEANGFTQTASGYEVGWSYFGLEFAYGAYLEAMADAAGAVVETTAGQAFSISYTVDF